MSRSLTFAIRDDDTGMEVAWHGGRTLYLYDPTGEELDVRTPMPWLAAEQPPNSYHAIREAHEFLTDVLHHDEEGSSDA